MDKHDHWMKTIAYELGEITNELDFIGKQLQLLVAEMRKND